MRLETVIFERSFAHMAEIRDLFKQLLENFKYASYDFGEAVEHMEDAARVAYDIVRLCKAATGLGPEEEEMCKWATAFARLGEELYTADGPCRMYAAYEEYRRGGKPP